MNLNPLSWLRRALAAPLLAERCNLLEEALAAQMSRNNVLARRNLEQLHTAALQTQMIEGLQRQLEVNRALLAVVMRERDEATARDERHRKVLTVMQKARREEKQRLRLWLTRCTAISPSRN